MHSTITTEPDTDNMNANPIYNTFTCKIAMEDIPDLELLSPVLSQSDRGQDMPPEPQDLELPSPVLTIHTAGQYSPGFIPLPYPTLLPRTSLAPKDILALPSTSHNDTPQEHSIRTSIHDSDNSPSVSDLKLSSFMPSQIPILTTENETLRRENAALHHKIYVLEFEERVREAAAQVEEVLEQIPRERPQTQQSSSCPRARVPRRQGPTVQVDNDVRDPWKTELDETELAEYDQIQNMEGIFP